MLQVVSNSFASMVEQPPPPPPPPPPSGVCYFRTGLPPSVGAQLVEHPFSAMAACNRPIGTGAQYAGTSDPAYQDLNLVNRIDINDGNNYDHRWAVGTASDPLCTVAGQGVTLRIPANFAKNRTSGDRAVTIFDATTGITHQFFQFNHTSDSAASANGVYHPDLAALDYSSPWPNGTRISSSASRIAQSGLLWRGAEINPTSLSAPPIQHALHFIVGGRPGDGAMQCSRNFVWPASGVDGYINDPGNGLGHMDYGSLWAIPPSVDLTNYPGISPTNGGTVHRLRVARAFQDYGAYHVDTGAAMTARGDGTITPSVRTDLVNNLTPILLHLLRRVTNNAAGTLTVGGGEPVNQPNCGYNASGVAWSAP